MAAGARRRRADGGAARRRMAACLRRLRALPAALLLLPALCAVGAFCLCFCAQARAAALPELAPSAADAANVAGAADGARAAAPQGAAPAAELYLEVSVNGAASGLVLPFRQGPHGLTGSVQDLRELGLDPQLFGVAGQERFALDAVPGLTYAYDAAAQTLDLRLGDALRKPLQLRARADTVRPRAPAVLGADRGLLLNYDLFAQPGAGARVAALNELRVFGPSGVFSSSGNAILHGGNGGSGRGCGYVRYDSAWTWSSPDSLQTLQVGDFVTPALGWTRSLRMGGIEWRRNFDLRPDMLTYPLAALKGSAVVPSNVSLYVNGVEQFNAPVPGGPFVVDQVAGLNGAGQATIVTRDALGRAVSQSVPLYVDTRLLASGLSDFAFSLGALRRDYGIRSFGYGGAPAATGSLRRGWSDALTLEAHAELGRGLANGGAGALLRLGASGGVLSASLAASGRNQGEGRGQGGVQAGIGYQYVAPRVALDLQSRRASRAYADLGTLEGTPVARVDERASLSVGLPWAGSASVSLVHYRAPLLPSSSQGGAAVRLVSAAYSRSVGHGAFLSLGAYQDLARRATRGLQATLSIAFGERIAANAGASRQGGAPGASLGLARAPDFSGGWGWAVQKGRSGALDVAQAQVQYLGSAGQLTATAFSAGSTRSSSLGLSGAVVAMDGALVAARHVGNGFALVSAGVADLPVLHENRVIGRTGADGRLLVPDLVPYSNNLIAIDPSGLPADVRLDAASLSVAPRAGAGAVAAFRVARYRAATVIVQDAGGKPLPAGTPARLLGGGVPSLVGYDGVVFLDGLGDDNEIVLGQGAGACSVRFTYRPGAPGELPAIGPLRCVPAAGSPAAGSPADQQPGNRANAQPNEEAK
ncbi:fimbrial biogenesis outer membrane usher protein [Massilia forsythiae]|uniref:Fimbrial biogenesis outer membrane usher protein n=1 Tax=Massilia forsythiae TaxID=2728020 RepID=A0A7Z2VZC9_9BURK|nr:fimbria/pilus outer membrane usher protein [Massilia forsythiae]QJE01904.1 fimbrial biogenesis outer membrane usher protein [Massilia forsythiae]